MATIVIPFRRDAKSRLPLEVRAELALAMFLDVQAACAAVARTIVADRSGGQGEAVAEALRGIEGPVAIVNADLPCATSADIAALLDAAPSLAAASDGTTNALALLEPVAFAPLYGPGSAARFAALGLAPLELANLAEDVDTLADLERVAGRVGANTRAALRSLPVPV